jgi:hypothetical protein
VSLFIWRGVLGWSGIHIGVCWAERVLLLPVLLLPSELTWWVASKSRIQAWLGHCTARWICTQALPLLEHCWPSDGTILLTSYSEISFRWILLTVFCSILDRWGVSSWCLTRARWSFIRSTRWSSLTTLVRARSSLLEYSLGSWLIAVVSNETLVCHNPIIDINTLFWLTW